MANIIDDIISLEVSTYPYSMKANIYNGWTVAPPQADEATTCLPSGTIPSPYTTPPAPPISTLTDHKSAPNAILEDRDDYYLICFLPNKAGIIMDDPILVSKTKLSQAHPHLVRAWTADQQHRQTEAARRDRKIRAFLLGLQSTRTLRPPTPPPSLRHNCIPCDHPLPPGQARHWGALKPCAIHPESQTAPRVCQGCRVTQHLLLSESSSTDIGVAATKGVRVGVCARCAREALGKYGNLAGNVEECGCDRAWSCNDCRQKVIKKLVEARKGYKEGACGSCGYAGELVGGVERCLNCKGLRVYG